MTNDTAYQCSGFLFLSKPSSSSINKNFTGKMTWNRATSLIMVGQTVDITARSTAAINGVRFFMVSGNIAAGTVRLYGIKNS